MIVGKPEQYERLGRVGVKIFVSDRRSWGKLRASAQRRLLNQAHELGGDRVVEVTYRRRGWLRHRWLRASGTAVRLVDPEAPPAPRTGE